jgi:hypothetical protein
LYSIHESDTCDSQQVLATNAFPDKLCLSAPSLSPGSLKYTWPNVSTFATNADCQGSPTSVVHLNTTCGSKTVQISAGSAVISSFGKFSLINPTSGEGTGTSGSNNLAFSSLITHKSLFAFSIAITFCLAKF